MASRDDAQNRDLQLAFSLHRSGKFADAAKLYRKIIKRNPKEANALHSLGLIEAASGNRAEAVQLMARSLQVQAGNVQFMQNYATVLCQIGQFKTASDICLKGLEVDRRNAYLLYVAAAALLQQDRLSEALAMFDELLVVEPNNVAGLIERSSVHLALTQYEAASADIDKAIALQPRYAEAHLNRGILHGRLKRHDEAIAAFELTLKLNPNVANAWLGLGNVFLDLKRHKEAVSAYDRALSLAPGSAEVWLGRGNVFFDLRQYDQALSAYDKAIALQPRLAEAWLGRGNVFVDIRRTEEALSVFETALSLKPQSPEAWTGRGNALSDLKRYDDAFAAYDQAFALRPDLTGLEGDRLFVRMQVCDWRDFEAERDHLVRSIQMGSAAAAPFAFLSVASSVEDQLASARAWTGKRYPADARPLWGGERYQHEKIRIAYLSADFRQHPVAYLAAGLFEGHDRSQFEVVGISIGPNDGSDIRARLERGFDRFIDAAALGADEIAHRIRAEEVDILIDLNGFTQNARPQILARRPAPLQVNYLGFAGTMGADYIDYILADPVVIPPAHRHGYAEKVISLPNSFMPHDDTGRAISDRQLTRSEFGLPENGFVFCCFNNAYKFNPALFAARMKLLQAVDGSVLWLSDAGAATVANLRQAAAAAGVDPGRLVFAPRLAASADHLARHRLADLFLDTLPYNAHTTASDALWAGLPVLTQIGASFAGRVAASLLTALGLPELITESAEQFEQQALTLATAPARLAAIRERLAQHRQSQPLFDTRLLTRDIERAYAAIYRRHQDGLSPEHIDVPT
jgi:protein O-GlcNAc transferase